MRILDLDFTKTKRFMLGSTTFQVHSSKTPNCHAGGIFPVCCSNWGRFLTE